MSQECIQRVSLNPSDICVSFGSPQEFPCDELSLLKMTILWDRNLEVPACAGKGAWLHNVIV